MLVYSIWLTSINIHTVLPNFVDCTNLFLSFQLSYAINKVQLKMLQITSHTAQQTVTVRCKNLQLSNHQPLFTGFRKSKLAPETTASGCNVSSCRSVFLSHIHSPLACS